LPELLQGADKYNGSQKLRTTYLKSPELHNAQVFFLSIILK
jgi:hypothetical protein